MEQTLEAAVAAGKPPAIAQLELTTMAQLAADGALVPIPSLLGSSAAQALQKSVIPSIETANSYNGTVYTVPFGYNSNVLYYNKALIARAGLTPAELPTTWAELEKDSEQVTKATGGEGLRLCLPRAGSVDPRSATVAGRGRTIQPEQHHGPVRLEQGSECVRGLSAATSHQVR